MKTAIVGAVLLAGVQALGGNLTAKIAAQYKVKSVDSWQGGRRTVFDFQGHDAWVVEPPADVAEAKGRPWTWTLQWREAFVPRTGVPQLLKAGFHHVSIDTFRHRMDEEGLKVSKAFRDFLVDGLGLSPKANLIGMSWGGFFSVRFAERYPESVAKIYLDCPLLNFAGAAPQVDLGPWKAPDGGWAGDPRMPINMATALARAKIPILLVYGGADNVLDPKRNAELFIPRFREAGGEIRVIRRALYAHHPHGFEKDDRTIPEFLGAPASAPVQTKDDPPRKVLVGTVCHRFGGTADERAALADRLIGELAGKAAADHGGRRLDFVILPEAALKNPATTAAEKCVTLDFVRRTVGATARKHGCYVATGACLVERVGDRDCPRNACVLLDRTGAVAGVYNKVHTACEWGEPDTTVSEDGMVPGGGFPVFETDFGKVGFLICFDMSYADGWAELKRRGAELVAVTSMSPQVLRPSLFAHQHRYWVMTATPRSQAAVITPLGYVKGKVGGESVLLEEIDLSYVICHWSPELRGGAALEKKFGKDAYGGIYDSGEDNGIFWSNRADLPIGRMIEAINVRPRDDEAARAERVSAGNRVSARGTYR